MSLTKSSSPRIILGLMNFGPDVNAGGRITTLDEFNKCLDLLQQRGYNEIDTARLYMDGKQEEFTAATGWKEKRDLTLATKVYPIQPGFHRREILRQQLSESLKALQTDSVDIFYLHAADRSVPFAETLEAVDEMYREGKFRRLGLSNYAAFEIAEIVTMCNERGWVRPVIYQAMYNAITRSIESELIPCCRRYGMEIVVYNPLAGGLFSGKYSTATQVPTEGRYSDKNARASVYRERYFKDSVFNALKTIIEPVTKRHGLTLLETALRWLRHHSALRMKTTDDGRRDGILIGVSSISQLETNLDNLEKGPLPDEVVRALDDAWMSVKGTAANYWLGELEYTYDTEVVLFGGGNA